MGEVHDLVMRLGLQAARANAQSAAERRQIDLAAEIMAEESDAVGLAYSGFCMTSFPHRELADQYAQWIRTNGRFSLMVEPGALLIQGRPVHFGVPHGSRARMIMLYLTTQAVQKQTRKIELGGSLFEWMRKMAVPIGGANYKAVKEQAMRISACRLTVGWRNESGVEGFQRENIVKGMVLVPDDMGEGQGRLWRDTVEITDSFYEALITHPVPIWEPAIRKISGRSLAIDIYVWLAYRLYAIRKPTFVGWASIKEQFGPEYARMVDFRINFKRALGDALAVYPDAKLEIDDRKGLTLLPSRPAVPERKIVGIAAR